jgi:hypothetical protein
MKKTIITLIATLGLALGTTAAAAPASTTARLAARPIMTGDLSRSSGFPTKCPPAAPVGKALGLRVSGPTVVSYAAGLALECQYTSGKGKSTVTWEKATRAAFLSEEKAMGVKPITDLGKGVSAYSVASFQLAVQKGALQCIIEAFGLSLANVEALAKELLSSYW